MIIYQNLKSLIKFINDNKYKWENRYKDNKNGKYKLPESIEEIIYINYSFDELSRLARHNNYKIHAGIGGKNEYYEITKNSYCIDLSKKIIIKFSSNQWNYTVDSLTKLNISDIPNQHNLYNKLVSNIKESTDIFTSGDFAEYREVGEKRLKEMIEEDKLTINQESSTFYDNILNLESKNSTHNHCDKLMPLAIASMVIENYVNEESISEENIMNENLVLNNKDLEINLDKFESGKSNILLITGFSGSGKSTLASSLANKYKCTNYELDCLGFYLRGLLTKENAIGNEDGLVAFIESKKIKPDKDMSYSDEASLYREYIKFLISYCKKQKDQKFIIEGLQLYETYKEGDSHITSCPMIIKGTSGLLSAIRAAKRNNGSFAKEIGPLIKWAIKDDKALNALKKDMKESSISYEDSNSSSNNISIDLENFKAYHLVPKIADPNRKHIGCWDEELYYKTINDAISDAGTHNAVKQYNSFEAYVYTAGKNLEAIYLGTILIHDKHNPYDWEWVNQEIIKDSDYNYLKENPMVEAFDISNFYNEDYYE